MTFPWLFALISKFHDFSMTLPNLSQNSINFPEIPENFKIPEIPWLFHDRGNPVYSAYDNLMNEVKNMLSFGIRPHWNPLMYGHGHTPMGWQWYPYGLRLWPVDTLHAQDSRWRCVLSHYMSISLPCLGLHGQGTEGYLTSNRGHFDNGCLKHACSVLKAFLDDPLTKSPGLCTPRSPSTSAASFFMEGAV